MFQKFGVPRGLKNGKKAVNVFSAALDFLPLLKEQGHKHISVTMYVEDGLLHSALQKLQSGRHQRICQNLMLEDGEIRQQLVDTDWLLFLKFIAHPCSNSIKCGTRRLRSGDEIGDKLHVVTSSYLKGSSALFDHLDLFLLNTAEFAVREASREDLRVFWLHFGNER